MQNNNIKYINSLENDNIKQLIKIRDNKKYRRELSQCFIENEKIILDIDNDLIDELYLNELYDIHRIDLLKNKKINILNTKVYNKIKSTDNSQGIIAKANYKIKYDINELLALNDYLVLLLDDINDPGNLGTIYRMAEACGIKNIITTKNCVDSYSPKVIRATMGSMFRLNIYEIDNIYDIVLMLKNNNYIFYSTTLDTNNYYYDIDYKNKKNVVIFGNEANGIRKDLIDISDIKIKIPMQGNIESLNVAVSASIISYEIYRQVHNEK